MNDNEVKAIARHEITLNLDELLDSVRKLLKDNGTFAMVHRTERLMDILEVFRKYNIEPKTFDYYVEIIQRKNIELYNQYIKTKKEKTTPEEQLPPVQSVQQNEQDVPKAQVNNYAKYNDKTQDVKSDIASNNVIVKIVLFVIALVFAYWVNKTVVFNSKCENFKALLKEITSFTVCRLFTQAVSLGMMNLAVIIHMNDILMKVIANIVVIILNYVFSKLFVFKKTDK